MLDYSLIGQQPPYVLQAMTLGQKYHLLKHHFVPSIDHRNTREDVSDVLL